MADYDTFKDIKIGDKVLLYKSSMWGRRSVKLTKVSKVNKVTFQVEHSGFTYRKYNGHVYGDTYSSHFIEPYDEEKYNKIVEQTKEREKRNNLISKIKDAVLTDLSTEQLEQIVNIIIPKVEEKENV